MMKPPIGLTPKVIHDGMRIDEIINAVERYLCAGLHVPPEWVAEYNELVSKREDV